MRLTKTAREKRLDSKPKRSTTIKLPQQGWIRLAEDAERDAEKAMIRSAQLRQAAQIFRRNAQNGEPFPVESSRA